MKQLLTICKIILLFGNIHFALAQDNYSVKLGHRGIIFADTPSATVIEAQLCSLVYCLFVEQRELELLNIDLGDNVNQIFANLKAMDEIDKSWLFNQLENIQNIEQ